MKQLMIATALLAFVGAGCENKKSSTSTDRNETVQSGDMLTDTASAMQNSESSGSMQQAVTDIGVTSFVKKALSGGMMEVEIGSLAAANAKSQRVKDFGAMMVADHGQAGNELKQMASGNSIEVPTAMMPEHQAHVDMLKNRTGAAFDKAYMDMMVKDHQKDIADYTKASQELSVASYKDFAGKTLPVLEKHLDSARAVQKSVK